MRANLFALLSLVPAHQRGNAAKARLGMGIRARPGAFRIMQRKKMAVLRRFCASRSLWVYPQCSSDNQENCRPLVGDFCIARSRPLAAVGLQPRYGRSLNLSSRLICLAARFSLRDLVGSFLLFCCLRFFSFAMAFVPHVRIVLQGRKEP